MTRALASLLLATVAVAQPVAAAPGQARATDDWHRITTMADRDRLRRLRDAWIEGIRLAYAKGAGPAVRAEGQLLDPDAALADPLPPAGNYRCRIFRLGGVAGFAVQPAAPCRIATLDGVASFTTLGRAQRVAGRLYADTDIRGVFLGALALPEETRVMPYGRDTVRDMAGVVKRIGPKHWRISFPYPHFEAVLEVIELVPTS